MQPDNLTQVIPIQGLETIYTYLEELERSIGFHNIQLKEVFIWDPTSGKKRSVDLIGLDSDGDCMITMGIQPPTKPPKDEWEYVHHLRGRSAE